MTPDGDRMPYRLAIPLSASATAVLAGTEFLAEGHVSSWGVLLFVFCFTLAYLRF